MVHRMVSGHHTDVFWVVLFVRGKYCIPIKEVAVEYYPIWGNMVWNMGTNYNHLTVDICGNTLDVLKEFRDGKKNVKHELVQKNSASIRF